MLEIHCIKNAWIQKLELFGLRIFVATTWTNLIPTHWSVPISNRYEQNVKNKPILVMMDISFGLSSRKVWTESKSWHISYLYPWKDFVL